MSASESIYHEIRERISLLHYPPGTALGEKVLAEEFGVSRTPIRRVLHRLEFEGLVTISRGAGTMVTGVDLKRLKEVYALRLKLLELMGELAPARIGSTEIEEMEALHGEIVDLGGAYDPEGLARLYNRFHRASLPLIGNAALRQFSDQLYYQTVRVWLQVLPDLNWDVELEMVDDEIRSAIEALKDNDLQRVAEIRRRHMSLLLGRLNDYLGSAISG